MKHTMPRLLALLSSLACLTATVAHAAPKAPDTIAAQGALRSNGGGPVADGNYVLFLKIYDSPTAANPVWKEVQPAVAVQGGLFAVEIGKEEPGLSAQLATGGQRWLGVQVGSDAELPRVSLSTAPAAHFAYAAGTAQDLQCSGCVGAGQLADGAVTAAKVGFNYAASDDKGGAANLALQAKQADVAKIAQSAQSATYAEDAGSLSCTGCVGLAQLGQTATQAFVASSGGTVSGDLNVKGALAVQGGTTLTGATSVLGPATLAGTTTLNGATTAQAGLTVAKGLDLGSSVISGGRLALIDTAKTPCGDADTGRIGLGSVNKRLYFCDGSAWKRLSMCSEVCAQPEQVACGKPLTDACGEGSCAGTGTLCPAGQSCNAGVCACSVGSQASPASSCAAIQACNASSPSGVYWLDIDGAGAKPAVQGYCDMTTEGGPWMLLYSYYHPAGQTGKAVDATVLPTDPAKGYSHRLLTDLGVVQSWAKEVRFYCQTSAHSRKINFRTNNANILSSLWDGKSYAGAGDWKAGFTPMTGHNANLPAATDSVWSSGVTAGMTEFPFYKGGAYHWGLRGSTERWECDDFPSGPANETLHQVWVK